MCALASHRACNGKEGLENGIVKVEVRYGLRYKYVHDLDMRLLSQHWPLLLHTLTPVMPKPHLTKLYRMIQRNYGHMHAYACIKGWPGPNIYTVYDRILGDFLAKTVVYTPHTYGFNQPRYVQDIRQIEFKVRLFYACTRNVIFRCAAQVNVHPYLQHSFASNLLRGISARKKKGMHAGAAARQAAALGDA
jgi:hypothetical protein